MSDTATLDVSPRSCATAPGGSTPSSRRRLTAATSVSRTTRPGEEAADSARRRSATTRRTGRTSATRGDAYLESMAAIYAGCHAVLRPGGLLVTVTRNSRRSGRLVDLAATTVRLAEAAGFAYLQHVIALNCAIRGGELVAHPSFWPLIRARAEAGRGVPSHLVVHDDVLLFQKPEGTDV